MMTMDMGMYGNQGQQGACAGDYCQQGYQPYEPYHEGYYEPAHYYEPLLQHAPAAPPAGLEHAPAPAPPPPAVISTDAGLCYTNLDYGDLQHGYGPTVASPAHPHHAPVHPAHVDHKLDGHYLDTKYGVQFVDDGGATGAGAAGPLQYAACAEYESYAPKEEFPSREAFPRDAECAALHAPGGLAHHHVPTYKWMQVKRNVPKPAGDTEHARSSNKTVVNARHTRFSSSPQRAPRSRDKGPALKRFSLETAVMLLYSWTRLEGLEKELRPPSTGVAAQTRIHHCTLARRLHTKLRKCVDGAATLHLRPCIV
ncbi:hypothetical protein EVAR_35773_1 [Eumeta japonica]|uniref:Uncharacterized protein n=1 Tax=Eumeta variegata TaxID=151549 RepID=A0A4C1WR44_EUMVA|nr:hypothetical protein EVAR_35773_1 [Eumeta japonica]